MTPLPQIHKQIWIRCNELTRDEPLCYHASTLRLQARDSIPIYLIGQAVRANGFATEND